MKVFISYSGVRGKHIAESLHWWLPHVIQSIVPFVSTQDIKKGENGEVIIQQNLAETNVGIICLTPESLNSTWIHFEAGALSKMSATACTFLFDLKIAEVPRPLGQFQHTEAELEDIRALTVRLNELLPNDRKLDSDRMKITFDTWWPQLKEKLDKTPPRPETEPIPQERTEKEMLAELLELARAKPQRRELPFKELVDPDVILGMFTLADAAKLRHVLEQFQAGKKLVLEPGGQGSSLMSLLRLGLLQSTSTGELSITERGKALLAKQKHFERGA